jgi:hypothetical protein
MVQIVAPDGKVGAPPLGLAPAPRSLAGLAIGVLDNRKPNAGLLLDRVAERLAARTGATVGLRADKNAAIPCEDQVLDRMTKEVQVVLTGSAD